MSAWELTFEHKQPGRHEYRWELAGVGEVCKVERNDGGEQVLEGFLRPAKGCSITNHFSSVAKLDAFAEKLAALREKMVAEAPGEVSNGDELAEVNSFLSCLANAIGAELVIPLERLPGQRGKGQVAP